MINSLVNIILHSPLISTVGYFNRLKNQSDPLSRQVAINMDSNTQVCKLMIDPLKCSYCEKIMIVQLILTG